jgi:hypothetical protein
VKDPAIGIINSLAFNAGLMTLKFAAKETLSSNKAAGNRNSLFINNRFKDYH